MKTPINRIPPLADLKAAALGRWPEIHTALGIAPEYLNPRKHCPCPYCGGRDRYRYTDHQGSGAFICNQCTPEGGSGFDLLMLVYGFSFATAAREVAAVLGMAKVSGSQYTPRTAPTPPPAKPERDRQGDLNKLLAVSLPITPACPVAGYLQSRGLPPTVFQSCADVFYQPDLLYWHHTSANTAPLLDYYPAMLAAIRSPDGQLQGLHKTYLQAAANGQGWHKLAAAHPDTGETLPAKKMQSRFSGSLKGAAVHLAAPDTQGRLMVAEGIETALAANVLFGIPAIAALSAYGMAALQWPSSTRELFIVADNDSNGTGMKAAHDLAVRAVKAGLSANIWQPPAAGLDALDVLNHRQQGGKA